MMHHHQHHHVPLKGLFGAADLDPMSAAAVSAAQLAMLDSLRYLPNLAHHNPALIHTAQVEHYQVPIHFELLGWKLSPVVFYH